MNQLTLGNGRMRPFQGSSGRGLPLTCKSCLSCAPLAETTPPMRNKIQVVVASSTARSEQRASSRRATAACAPSRHCVLWSARLPCAIGVSITSLSRAPHTGKTRLIRLQRCRQAGQREAADEPADAGRRPRAPVPDLVCGGVCASLCGRRMPALAAAQSGPGRGQHRPARRLPLGISAHWEVRARFVSIHRACFMQNHQGVGVGLARRTRGIAVPGPG